MIMNTNEAVLKNIPEAEIILRTLRDKAVELEKDKKLTINTMKKLIGEVLGHFYCINNPQIRYITCFVSMPEKLQKMCQK